MTIPEFKIDSPNFTQMPNILLDKWLPFLKEIELKVLLTIYRKTFGWQKRKDIICLNDFMLATGSSKTKILDAIDLLIEKKLITKIVIGGRGKQKSIYEIIICEPEISDTKNRGDKKSPVRGDKLSPTKERELNKEINKEIKKERKKDPKPLKIKISENIEMTERDYQKLIEKYGSSLLKEQQEEYDRWKYNNAVTCDDYRGLNNWLKRHTDKVDRQKISSTEIINKNIQWLKGHIKHLTSIGARGNLQFNDTEVYDSVLGKRFLLSAKNLIDIVKSWDQDRRW